MAFSIFIVVASIGCILDTSHGWSGAADIFVPEDCQEHGCQHNDLDFEVVDGDEVLSFLQKQMTISAIIDRTANEKETRITPKDVQGTKEAVLEDSTDNIVQEKLTPMEEDRSFAQHNLTMQGVSLQFCEMKLNRFKTLDNQSMSEGSPDSFFPPDATSIAENGTSCGDSAQGNSASCERFNTWKTFQEVAVQLGTTFKVIGGSGITFDDIQQGYLGNCYFLVALAAIAISRPEIISEMFVERELWDQNIFKTKWLLNGVESVIAVDNMIPASDTNTYFTHPSKTGEFWTVILSKTWAKIFGNFRGIEGGDPGSVIKAITRAPGRYIHVATETEDSLWQTLLDGTANKYPMSAGTCGGCGKPDKYQLARGHAYAILGAYLSDDYGPVVKMYNPWGHDYYKGAVPNTEEVNGPKDGVFTLQLKEFLDAYEAMEINYVQSGYQVTSKTVPAGQANAQNVNMSVPGKFWVSLVWPSLRMVYPCPYLNPTSSIKGQLSSAKGEEVGTMLSRMSDDSDVAAEFENEAGGIYNILAKTTFRASASWLNTVSFDVYAPVAVDILDHPMGGRAVSLELFGPVKDGKACEVITVSGDGLFIVDRTMDSAEGVPTYWSLDRRNFAFHVPHEDLWWIVHADYYSRVLEGELWHHAKFRKTPLICGCEDSATGVPGFGELILCESATDTNYTYSNVKCSDAKYSYLVQQHCPKSCGVCPDTDTVTSTTSAQPDGDAVISTTSAQPDGDD